MGGLRFRQSVLTEIAVVATFAWGAPAAGQALRGYVRAAETQRPVPYATVVLTPGFPARFTDDSGRFAFGELAGGRYRLIVRAIGYTPFDTVIDVTAAPRILHIDLGPLAFELPPVTVSATQICANPGPPSRDSQPQLAAIFDELRESAARLRLLSDAYPFKYWILRRFQSEGSQLVLTDTLEYRSDARHRYAPGRLLGGYLGTLGARRRELRIPNTTDLADSAFHRVHCFAFGGVELFDGRPQLRVDFLAAERLRAPDVDGTAWLDSATHELRRLTFRLTHPGRALAGLQGLDVTVMFGEVLPSVSVPSHVVSVTSAKDGGTGLEEQRLLRWVFLRRAPGSQPP